MGKELLYKLGESNLEWPVGLRDYIYTDTGYQYTPKCGSYYVDTLEIWEGKLLMRTFAYEVPKASKPKDMRIQEVCRRLEGEKEVLLCQIENQYMQGRTPVYTEDGRWTTRDNGYYYGWYVGDKKSWWFDEYKMYDVDEWIKKLGIPYCGYNHENYENKIPFFQYVELYRKYPKIELLAKAGWGNLITGARYFNFKGKSFEQIFKIPKYWQKYLNQFEVSDILFIRKNKPSSMVELNIMKRAKYYRYNFIIKYLNKKMVNYIENYNQCEGFPSLEYNDYLRMAEKLGYPMDHNDVLCPKNGVYKAHDELQEKFDIAKTKELAEGIKRTAESLMKYKYENEEFVVIPAKDNDELIKESEVLHHCVRTYAENVAEGKTGIMFIRKKDCVDEPFVTAELRGKQIIQVRAKNNAQPSPDVINFVKKWEKKYQLAGY